MTSTLEQNVLTILRERHLFNIAARTHAKWRADLEAKYLKGPRGGINPIVRSARKMQDKIAKFGPEALVDELLPHLVYAAERWQQMTDPDVARSRPYLRYVCACLPDSRPSHLEKHGLVFSMDHHFWDLWYPLNGLGCMCTVTSVSEDLLVRRGWSISENCRFEFSAPDEGFDFNVGKVLSKGRVSEDR
jgi:hypothetical protein